MQSASPNRLGRRSKRGVSPIIATILLVAITVVLAAVLYILVSGLIGGTKSTTVDIAPAFSANAAGSCGTTTPANTYNITLNPSATATTATFGIQIKAGTGSIYAIGAPTGVTGAATSPLLGPTGCGTTTAGAGWFGVLWTPTGTILATYGTGGTNGWSADTASGNTLPVTVASGSVFEVVALASIGTDTIYCVGINGNSVTGSTSL